MTQNTAIDTHFTGGICLRSEVLFAVMAITITVTAHCPIWHVVSPPSPFLRSTFTTKQLFIVNCDDDIGIHVHLSERLALHKSKTFDGR